MLLVLIVKIKTMSRIKGFHPKVVKVRKEHTCVHCNRVIQVGELANFFSERLPRYDFETDKQIGIIYHKAYTCDDDYPCGYEMPF
jgi:hypothetical protein